MAHSSIYIGIFGYGSLVNRRTRQPKTPATPFVIRGWQRHWGHCIEVPQGKVCGLTIRPKIGVEVAGALVREDVSSLQSLDEREKGYVRVCLTPLGETVPVPDTVGGVDVFTYTSEPPIFRPGDHEYPIWRSYLECVLAGFLDVGGSKAAQGFIESTLGWEAPILDDRETPKYPRAYTLPKKHQAIVNSLMRKYKLETNQF